MISKKENLIIKITLVALIIIIVALFFKPELLFSVRQWTNELEESHFFGLSGEEKRFLGSWETKDYANKFIYTFYEDGVLDIIEYDVKEHVYYHQTTFSAEEGRLHFHGNPGQVNFYRFDDTDTTLYIGSILQYPTNPYYKMKYSLDRRWDDTDGDGIRDNLDAFPTNPDRILDIDVLSHDLSLSEQSRYGEITYNIDSLSLTIRNNFDLPASISFWIDRGEGLYRIIDTWRMTKKTDIYEMKKPLYGLSMGSEITILIIGPNRNYYGDIREYVENTYKVSII